MKASKRIVTTRVISTETSKVLRIWRRKKYLERRFEQMSLGERNGESDLSGKGRDQLQEEMKTPVIKKKRDIT